MTAKELVKNKAKKRNQNSRRRMAKRSLIVVLPYKNTSNGSLQAVSVVEEVDK
jgi:hypothetical protein